MPCPARRGAATNQSLVHVGGQRRLPTYATAVDAVSATLMSNQLAGEYAYTRRRRDSHQLRSLRQPDATTCEAMQRPFDPAMGQQHRQTPAGAEFDMSFDREEWGTYDDFPMRPFILE